jgi:hypothetical protein
MPGIILAVTLGGIFLYSSIKGLSVVDILGGKGTEGDPLDPSGAHYQNTSAAGGGIAPTEVDSGSDKASNVGGSASVSGSPKNVIDTVVLPIARQYGISRTVAQNDAGNASHGPTVTGTRSDHQGPPSERWAADMSNGSAPTPQMDRLAKALATRFNIPWNGSGASSATHGGYRYQLIYRSMVGGNHYNHVHLGIAKV